MRYFELNNNPGTCVLKDIPVLDYNEFRELTVRLLSDKANHAVNYFASKGSEVLKFYMIIANDRTHKILLYSHEQDLSIKLLRSITSTCFQLHIFEREIHEQFGIDFAEHPWLKPLRYSHDRKNSASVMDNYPFYKIEGEEMHEVGVGPVHAGVIEPGHFRFLCYGEKVHHLEIHLGYQHRGIERLFSGKGSFLKKAVLSESIAGDTSVGHALAFAQLTELLGGIETVETIGCERIIALELERMAVHAGDTAALCGDVAFQLGQAICEALRTIIINTTQDWCGNRFGKGLVRPGGTNYPLNRAVKNNILDKLADVYKRFHQAGEMIYENSGILGRFENIGVVKPKQAHLAGAVGMASRASGIERDIRASHPFQSFIKHQYHTPVLEQGDVLARGLLRIKEFELSYNIIKRLLDDPCFDDDFSRHEPDYGMKLKPGMFGVSLVEGWRGEICHTLITDIDGNIMNYKIKDPSLHNWLMLALAVRDQEISDFPLCNKSFNLSYCGNDL